MMRLPISDGWLCSFYSTKNLLLIRFFRLSLSCFGYLFTSSRLPDDFIFSAEISTLLVFTLPLFFLSLLIFPLL